MPTTDDPGTPSIDVNLYLGAERFGPGVDLTDGSRFPQFVDGEVILDNDIRVRIYLSAKEGAVNLEYFGIMPGSRGQLNPVSLSHLPFEKMIGRMKEAAIVVLVADTSVDDRSRKYRRHTMTEDLLREVAAIVCGDVRGQRNRAVMNRFGVSPRTATRWIKAAAPFISEGSE